MKRIFPLAILFLILSQTRTWGAEPYPALYRGEITESGPRLLGHFQKSFIAGRSADSIRTEMVKTNI